MKIAMWTSWETRCGIASYTASLVDELRRGGTDVEIVPVPYANRDPASIEKTLTRLNQADLVHVQHEYDFWGGVMPGVSSLGQFYRRLERPRVVTAHTVFTAAELLGLPRERRPRHRIAKQLLVAYPHYRASLERLPFAGAGAVIVHTRAARERLVGRGLPAKCVHILPAGIPSPAEAHAGEAEQMRARFGLEGSRVLAIFGYVTANKGYEVALDALASLPPNVRLLVAGGARVEGERPYLERLQETIGARGLADRVTITGYLEEPEVAALMELADLVLVPHTAANGSYSVMISLSYGKPVLASDLACFQELKEERDCLELFPAGDAAALAGRARSLLDSGAARSDLARRARACAVEGSWARVAQKTGAIYQAVLRKNEG